MATVDVPLGSLRLAVSYPAPEGTFSDDHVREVLRLLSFDGLTTRLDECEPSWTQQLSPNEAQRLSIARVLLNAPDWVFLDKATSTLDDDMEKRVYDLLAERLPRTTVVSILHRPELAAYHTRHLRLAPTDHGSSALRAA